MVSQRKLNGKLRKLAQYMVERRGKFISREQILTDVFGMKPGSESRTIDTHIQWLRGYLGESEEIMSFRSQVRTGYILAQNPGGEI